MRSGNEKKVAEQPAAGGDEVRGRVGTIARTPQECIVMTEEPAHGAPMACRVRRHRVLSQPLTAAIDVGYAFR